MAGVSQLSLSGSNSTQAQLQSGLSLCPLSPLSPSPDLEQAAHLGIVPLSQLVERALPATPLGQPLRVLRRG